MSGQFSRPGRFTTGERARRTHWIGNCVGPRSELLWKENNFYRILTMVYNRITGFSDFVHRPESK
jgi:hypothetical protein